MTNIAAERRQFAAALRASRSLRSDALVDALASVPRERFLPPGPWHVVGGQPAGLHLTPDDDPRHVYADVSVAIDAARHLFNGAPGIVAGWLDALQLVAGDRLLHIGCGLGYYSAVASHIVGPNGRVAAIEVDDVLADGARRNLASLSWVEVHAGDGTRLPPGPFDAILIHAGITHPLDEWLEALAPHGRLLLPLTATIPAMGPLGKGRAVLLTGTSDGAFDVAWLDFVMIYSAVGVRDEGLNTALGTAYLKPAARLATRLRRDPHQLSDQCWFHGPAFCFTR